MTTFWSIFVIVFAVLTGVGSVVLLLIMRKADGSTLEGEELNHEFDGIRELNNPLPRWWLSLYLLTFFFGIGYLVLYPGFGNFPGVLNWSSASELAKENAAADAKYNVIYEKYAQQSVEELLNDEKAIQLGQRLYLANCIACHGSDGGGSRGFPNLKDDDWLYGKQAEQIKHSIAKGRQGNMPPFGPALGDQGIIEITAYIRALAGSDDNSTLAEAGQQKFSMFCAACHGQDAKGNIMFGAPDLSDTVWLYGGSDSDIRKTLMEGRQGNMPAHEKLMDENKIHILSAYVLSLSKQ